MTMKIEPRTIPAGKFKAQCLAILDRVAESGEPVVVTKRGRPVAKVVPVRTETLVSLAGSVTFHGDITAPILDEWDIDR
jgi:prevent-host-death family protein